MAASTVRAVNHVRARHGLPALATERLLACAARRHVRRMRARGFFAHVGPGEVSLAQRVLDTGWLHGARTWQVGEVLVAFPAGTASGRRAAAAWMHSPPHRAEVLGPYAGAGAAVARSGGQVLITLDFGRRG